MLLVKAGAPVDSTIDLLMPLLEKGDIIIDGGNEWYENTEHRQKKVAEKGLMYLGMGVSGGEEGARNGKPPETVILCEASQHHKLSCILLQMSLCVHAQKDCKLIHDHTMQM